MSGVPWCPGSHYIVSDGWLRSVIRAKFRVSRAVATWDARTLSTATRIFTNSADNCMATEQTARSTQARKAAGLRRNDACRHACTEILRYFCRWCSVNVHTTDLRVDKPAWP